MCYTRYIKGKQEAQVTYIGQYAPETRARICQYCGAAVEPTALYDACGVCDTRNLFSDLYKDEVGIRPDLSGWSLAQMRASLRANKVVWR
jgi:hypothetical protein